MSGMMSPCQSWNFLESGVLILREMRGVGTSQSLKGRLPTAVVETMTKSLGRDLLAGGLAKPISCDTGPDKLL